MDSLDLLVPLVRGPLCEVLTAPSVWGLSADWLAVSLSDSWTTKEGCLSVQVSQRAHLCCGLKSIHTHPLLERRSLSHLTETQMPLQTTAYCTIFQLAWSGDLYAFQLFSSPSDIFKKQSSKWGLCWGNRSNLSLVKEWNHYQTLCCRRQPHMKLPHSNNPPFLSLRRQKKSLFVFHLRLRVVIMRLHIPT